jgi:hypothetical protein
MQNMSNPQLERETAVHNLTTDLAWRYGSKLPDWPSAESSLNELAHMAEQDFAWALRAVMDEWEYIRYGGYL